MRYIEYTVQKYFESDCDICEKSSDDCDCPICPTCGKVGNLDCIKHFEDHIAKLSEIILTMKKRRFTKTHSKTVS